MQSCVGTMHLKPNGAQRDAGHDRSNRRRFAFFAIFGNVDQRGQPSPGLLAPCLGLALVAGAALWVGLGSIVVLLAA